MTPHAILMVLPNVTPEELKAAYRRHVGAHHPDRGGDPVRFSQVVAAYKALRSQGVQLARVCETCSGWGVVGRKVAALCPACGGSGL